MSKIHQLARKFSKIVSAQTIPEKNLPGNPKYDALDEYSIHPPAEWNMESSQKELWNPADKLWDILPAGFSDAEKNQLPVGSVMKILFDNAWHYHKKTGPNQWVPFEPNKGSAPVEYRFDVKEAQKRLNALGYTPALNPDGKLGKLTRAALQWFREHYPANAGLNDESTIDAVVANQRDEDVAFPVDAPPAKLPAPHYAPSTWGNTKASKLANEFAKTVQAGISKVLQEENEEWGLTELHDLKRRMELAQEQYTAADTTRARDHYHMVWRKARDAYYDLLEEIKAESNHLELAKLLNESRRATI